jgi:hypothetical protein
MICEKRTGKAEVLRFSYSSPGRHLLDSFQISLFVEFVEPELEYFRIVFSGILL